MPEKLSAPAVTLLTGSPLFRSPFSCC